MAFILLKIIVVNVKSMIQQIKISKMTKNKKEKKENLIIINLFI